jgi:hypothetical protein
MGTISRIVAGGGWKGTLVERVKVKAWIALFGAIGLGSISVLAVHSIWFYSCIPAGVSFLTSLVLFVRERPREIEFPWHRAEYDPRNLYGAFGSIEHKIDDESAESGAAPNGGPDGPRSAS